MIDENSSWENWQWDQPPTSRCSLFQPVGRNCAGCVRELRAPRCDAYGDESRGDEREQHPGGAAAEQLEDLRARIPEVKEQSRTQSMLSVCVGKRLVPFP